MSNDTGKTVNDKPVLFIHIPKTAGGSFLTILGNLFGERRVVRLERMEEMEKSQIDRLLARDLKKFDCLMGHFPIHVFTEYRSVFRAFTMLRDPVERVLSHFRFYKSRPRGEMTRLELREDFTLEDFLESQFPENYAQTRNLMCRMLCGDAKMLDPSNPSFWDPEDPGAMVEQSLANLGAIDFGIVEQMEATLMLLRHAWGLDTPLEEYHNNWTGPSGEERNPRCIQRIVDLNTSDIALYAEARRLFQNRVRALTGRQETTDPHAKTLPRLRVQPGLEVTVDQIPARQGFHEIEAGGFAWLVANQTGLIAFDTEPRVLRLRIALYCVTDCFPVGEIVVTVNETRLSHDIVRTNENFVTIETEPFRAQDGPNVLRLAPPFAVPARFVNPTSGDERYLSVALVRLIFFEHQEALVNADRPEAKLSKSPLPLCGFF